MIELLDDWQPVRCANTKQPVGHEDLIEKTKYYQMEHKIQGVL